MTREHGTEHNSGEAGNERCSDCSFACLGSSPLAAGRVARDDDGELLHARSSLLRWLTSRKCSAHCLCPRASRLTFDMSGRQRRRKPWPSAPTKPAVDCPLDEAVRRLVEQNLLACHEGEFAMQDCERQRA